MFARCTRVSTRLWRALPSPSASAASSFWARTAANFAMSSLDPSWAARPKAQLAVTAANCAEALGPSTAALTSSPQMRSWITFFCTW